MVAIGLAGTRLGHEPRWTRSPKQKAGLSGAPPALSETADPGADPQPTFADSAAILETETRRFQRVSEERMMGLEPTTFCMARTVRELTGDDWSRQIALLTGLPT
jgi:hypothetical protein